MSIKRLFNSLLRRADKTDYSSKYTVHRKRSVLGCGGNGDVRRATSKESGNIVALKCLNKSAKANKEKVLRFEDEISTMIQAGKQIKGIIPIIDYSIKGCWYVMPIAEGIKGRSNSIEEIIAGILQVAETLVGIHAIGLSHRDIKPDNMLYYNDRWVLCDFGLVDIPDNPHNLTKNSTRVGAVKTIAPEMSRNAKDADGKKADVYSLAKSLWILLTNNDDSFEGHYEVTDASMSLHEYKDLRRQHLVEIDELLEAATKNEPNERPTMAQFVSRLKLWQEINKDVRKQQISNWNFLKQYLFHGDGPQRCVWEAPTEIMRVMNLISLLPLYSHLFFPDRGWVEYQKVEIATEPGCLDIYTSFGIFRIYLGRLFYESFNQPYWNYFMLEAEPMSVVVGAEVDTYYERVVEDRPSHYVSGVDSMYGVYDYETGKMFPQGARVIMRCLKGKFLIVLKYGPYNQITPMDDGRHANCSSDEFRDYVDSLQKLFSLRGLVEETVWEKMYDSLVSGCPFIPNRVLPEVATDNIKGDPMFVKNNWPKFDFHSFLSKFSGLPAGKAKYRFSFHLKNDEDLMKMLRSGKERCLCKDGYIRELKNDSEDIFDATDRESAIEILKGIEEVVNSYCDGKVNSINKPYFSVKIIKTGHPEYLFTLDDIRTLMLEADDRVNNTLVIDENGHARLLSNQSEVQFYPVINETWCARNKYVGKYSTLSDLESSYHYSLGKWRDYLSTGIGQQMDDYDGYHESNEELLRQIKEIDHQ